MNADRHQRFPIRSLDQDKQAQHDAAELADTIRCTAECYRIAPDRMGRALAVLARQWPTR